jgi:hypothetical protein
VEVIVAAARTRLEKLGQPFTHRSLRKLAGYVAGRDRPVRVGRERLRQILHAHGISSSTTLRNQNPGITGPLNPDDVSQAATRSH